MAPSDWTSKLLDANRGPGSPPGLQFMQECLRSLERVPVVLSVDMPQLIPKFGDLGLDALNRVVKRI